MRRERQKPTQSIDRIQRWLQGVIVHPGDVDAALASADAAAEFPPEALGEVVTPSHTMSSSERVAVYHGMYMMRMVEAMEADYPATRHFLDEEKFEDLVRDYIQHFPSQSYTLNRLGDHFPEFLGQRPEDPDGAFLADLAGFELAVTQVFDEEETPVLSAEDLQAVPADAWDRAVLEPISAFRLLKLSYSVVPHLRAFHEQRPCPRPRRRNTWIAVYRRDYSVLYLELTRAEHDLLEALTSGTSLADGLEAATLRLRSGQRQEKIFKWFRTWVAEGLFSSVRLSEK